MPHRAIAKLSTDHPLLVAMVILLVVVIPGFWRTQQAIDAANHASEAALRVSVENRSNAVTACQNANDQREANRTLWVFVLTVSAANRTEPQTEQQKLISEKFRVWVTQLFAPRDCSDLSKKYKIPPPPDIPGLTPSTR